MTATDLREQWTAAMRSQDLRWAWRIGDQVLRERPPSGNQKHTGPRHLQRIWEGKPLENARVLVRCYHGLGDTIQFIRFAAPLRRIAREVIVWCQPELLPLVSRIPHVNRVLPLSDGEVEAAFDLDVEVMELPHALSASAAIIAAEVPYLSVFPERRPSESLGLHVGVVWQAGDWDPRRSVPRSFLEPLATIADVHLFSLQPGANLTDTPIMDLSSPSIETLAARMAALDVVLTVDTMAAHLAGALGLRVWTLLHSDPDWRWGNTHRCAWYPTMRLFRQSIAGDWSAPVLEAADALREPSVRPRT